ncbi:MAG: ATP-binding protein, partial [Sphingobacteriales bacterium]
MPTKENSAPKVLAPTAGRLIESLRDTGYTFPTAIADIVDNSISAEATIVKINLEQQFGGGPIFTIADNGKGMNAEELDKAMTYGSPLRENLKSLGKFGMGLKTASTSFCRKLTVISMQDGQLELRQWDLDLVAERNDWVLIEPDQEDYAEQIEILEEIATKGSGTLIVWENIDRLIRSVSEGTSSKNQIEKIIEELREHLSGVFYNFLTPGGGYPDVQMFINEALLDPWDPFCRWLNDPARDIKVEVNPNPIKVIRETNGKKEVLGEIVVNVYILPKSTELT